MSPQMQVLLANYVKRFTNWITWVASTLAAAFYLQDATTQTNQIAHLGFSPVWIPLVTLVLHILAGLVPQPDAIKQVPDASGNPPTPPSAG